MDENAVRVIVNDGFRAYEKDTGLPRHTQNLANFDKLFRLANRGIGVILAFGFLAGVPTAIAAVIEIVKFVKGHP